MSAMTAARPGLEALLEGLFDYAGTFAPASLPLDEALRESASFKTTLRRPGMLAADIVLPARELASLGERVRGLRACALGSWDSLRVDASAAAAGAASLLSLEVRLPASGRPRDAAAARDRLPSGARLFLEPDFSALESIETLADSLRAGDLGLKVRCVGPTAPSPEALASAVAAAAERALPLKATQGLHHALADEREEGGALGFVGLSAAVLLARGRRISRALVLECLLERRADAFDFSDGLRWRGHSLDAGELARAKSAAHFSIGSCSLREPDNELAELYP